MPMHDGPEGAEDESTASSHTSAIQREMSARTPDYSVISDRIARTYAVRREMIRQLGTAAIVNEYPALVLPAMVYV